MQRRRWVDCACWASSIQSWWRNSEVLSRSYGGRAHCRCSCRSGPSQRQSDRMSWVHCNLALCSKSHTVSYCCYSNSDSNSNSHDNVYGAIIVAMNCYCESSPGSFGQNSTSARWLPIFGPGRSAWTSDPPVGSYKYYINHRCLLLLSPIADTHLPSHGV